jgi:hypothetical protein
MSPSSDWLPSPDRTAYAWSDDNGVDAYVWKEHWRHWQMSYTLDHDSPTFTADLGKTRRAHTALERAELVIEDAQQHVSQTYQDMRTLVNLAREIEDVTPHEQAVIDRMTEALEQNPMFEQERLASEGTEQFRAETQAAYDAWQQDLQNTELEQDYFDKLTELDWNLAGRELERGETLDQEIPLRSLDQSIDRSLEDRGRDDR